MNVWSVRKQSESFRFARVPEGTLFVILSLLGHAEGLLQRDVLRHSRCFGRKM
jgi:hypothetical protein